MGQAQRKRVWVERWLMVCRELLGCCVCTPINPRLPRFPLGLPQRDHNSPATFRQPKQPTLSEISVGPAPTGSQLPSYLPPNQATHAFQDFRWACPNGITTPQLPSAKPSNPRFPRFPLGLPQRDHNSPATFRQPKQPTPSKISVGPAPTGSQLPSYLPPTQATHAFRDFRWACPNGITTPQLPSANPSNPRLPRFPLGLPQRDHNSPATFRQPKQPTPSKISVGPAPTGSQLPSYLPPTQATHAFQDFRWACPNGITTPQLPSANPSNPRFPRFPLGLPQRDHNSPATFRQPKQPTPSKISVGPAPTGSQLPSYLPPTQATHAFRDFRWACPNGITTPQLPSANPSNPRLPRFPLGLPQRDHNSPATFRQPKQPTPSKISVGPAPTGSQLPSYLPPTQATHAFRDFRWACPNGITTPQLPSANPSNPRLPRFPLGLPQRDHNSPATFRQPKQPTPSKISVGPAPTGSQLPSYLPPTQATHAFRDFRWACPNGITTPQLPSANPSNPRLPRFPLGLPQRDHNSPATFRQPKQPTPSKISVGPAPTGSQLPSYLPPIQATHAFRDFRWACPNGITTPQLPSANPSNPRLRRFPLGLPQRDHNCSATAVRRKLLSSL